MTTFLFSVLVSLGAGSASPDAAPIGLETSAARGVGARPDRPIQYRIEARLNPREHVLTGRTTIRYRSSADQPLGSLFLHLYPNSYRDRFSTAAREKDFYYDDSMRRIPRGDRGYLDVESLTVDGRPHTFLVLDTLLRVDLQTPLEPGGSVTVELAWFEKIRRHAGRGGYRDEHYDLAQWYPKMVRYHGGAWRAEPAHDAGDYDSDFADFEVVLSVPTDMTVVATGSLVEGDAGWDDAAARAKRSEGVAPGPAAPQRTVPRDGPVANTTHKTLRFEARSVLDFAWSADPDFRLESAVVAGSRVRVFYRPNHVASWSLRVLSRVDRILTDLARRYGPLPYGEIAVVDTWVDHAMSYPMLLMLREPSEAVLAHELVHQYFSVAVASDEINEAWLDEGLASWHARRFLVARHGASGVDPGDLDPYARGFARESARDVAAHLASRAARVHRGEPVATPAHEFRDHRNYLPAVQSKASLLLDALASAMGPETLDRALALYYERYRFAHADEVALRSTLEEVSGLDLASLFDGWLHEPGIADYRLNDIRAQAEGDGYRVAVDVERLGRVPTPVEVLFRFPGGLERRLAWDARTASATLTLDAPSRPSLVWLDPDAVALDANRWNNRSPRSFELVLDRPFQSYRPRDHYLLSWRPLAWYNFVDGMRLGLRLRGSQEGEWNRVELTPSLDVKRGRLDVAARWTSPLLAEGRTNLSLTGMKSEGRRFFRVTLVTDRSPRLERRPRTRIEVGASSLAVTESSYLRAGRFDLGTVNQMWVGYGGEYASPSFESYVRLRYQASGRQLHSDFAFNRASLALGVSVPRGSTTWRLRGFVGLSSDGERLPRQERFYLAGAGPMAEFENAGLRSRDSYLSLIHYHLPGDGNFRAYADAEPGLSARRLLAINFEGQQRLTAADSESAWLRVLGRPSLAVFADLAKAEGTGVAALGNALFGLGVGLRLEREIYGRPVRLRLDVPFYVNRPGNDGDGEPQDRVEPRWLLSLSPAL